MKNSTIKRHTTVLALTSALVLMPLSMSLAQSVTVELATDAPSHAPIVENFTQSDSSLTVRSAGPNVSESIFSIADADGNIDLNTLPQALGVSSTDGVLVNTERLLGDAVNENRIVSASAFLDALRAGFFAEQARDDINASKVSASELVSEAYTVGLNYDQVVALNELAVSLADDNGQVTVSTAIPIIETFLLENPGSIEGLAPGTPDVVGQNGPGISVTAGVGADVVVDTSVDVGGGVLIESASDVEVNNSGYIEFGESGVVVEADGNVVLSNSGVIDDTPQAIKIDATGDVDIQNTGRVQVDSFSNGSNGPGRAIEVFAEGNLTFRNAGTIETKGEVFSSSTVVEAGASGDVTFLNDGIVSTENSGGDAVEVFSENNLNATNSGQIIAGDVGIRGGAFGTTTVTNIGTITAGYQGIDIGSGAVSSVENTGEIVGPRGIQLSVFGGFTSFTDEETGEIRELDATGGTATVTNSGTIKLVDLGVYHSDQDRYELDGHILNLSQNVAIYAFSGNGATEVDAYYNFQGQLEENSTVWAATADSAADNSVVVNNSGLIDGSELESSGGIYTLASDGIEINNSGNIIVAGSAIFAIGNGPVAVENSGNISVTGQYGPHAIVANSGHWTLGTVGQDISITNSGNVDLTGAGDHRRGIRAWTNGGVATIINTGDVTTDANSARAIHASSGNDGYCAYDENGDCNQTPLVVGGNVKIDTDGTISTTGYDSRAVQAWTYGGDVDLKAAGEISTQGSNSNAIHAVSGEVGGGDRKTVSGDGGDIVLVNDAVVTTEGDYSRGINAWSNGGDVTATNNGEIKTSGENARGIQVRSGNDWVGNGGEVHEGGEVELTNNAKVETSGEWADALHATSTSGQVKVSNTSDLQTVGSGANGIAAYSGSNRDNDNQKFFDGADLNVVNSGNIKTNGDRSYGIEGWSNGRAVTIANGGDIVTSGDGSSAIGSYSGTNRTEDGRVVTVGSGLLVSNSGSLETSGSQTHVIDAYTNGGSINIELSETSIIQANGIGAAGVMSGSGNTRTDDGRVAQVGDDVTLNLAGTISTTGDSGEGALGWSNGGDVNITNNAEITTTGAGATGLGGYSGESREGRIANDGGIVNIINAGNISASGVDSAAISAASINSSVKIDNSAILSGYNGIVVEEAASSQTTTSGKIESSGGSAFISGDGADVLINTGDIFGDISTGAGDDVVNLNGIFSGNIQLGADNDKLNIKDIADAGQSTFSGDEGLDSVDIGGSGTLTGSQFSSFEHGTLSSGSWSLSRSLSFSESFTLNSDVVAALNGADIETANMLISSGASVSGSAVISGGLVNEGDIFLSSLDKLEIDGDFHSAAGSTVEFNLGGTAGEVRSNIAVTNGAFTFASSDVLNVGVDESTVLDGETEYEIATADGGVDDLATSDDAEDVRISSSSASYSFTRAIKNNALYVKVSSSIAALLGTEEAEAVEELISGASGAGEIGVALNGLDETELEQAVAELTAPNSASNQSSIGGSNPAKVVTNVVGNRISARFGNGPATTQNNSSNVSNYQAEQQYPAVFETLDAFVGEGLNGRKSLSDTGNTEGWIQVYWGRSDVNEANGNIYGTSVGIDHKVDHDLLLGASFSYSDSESKADNSSVDSTAYGGTLYGAKQFNENLLVSASLGYFVSDNSTKRTALGTTYDGDFDSRTFLANINLARTWDVNSWLVTPNAGLRYAKTSFDDYSENGGLGALSFKRDDLTSTELSAGLSFGKDIVATNGLRISPEIHFGALYELADNETVVSYRFAPTGVALSQSNSVPRLKFNVGGSLNAQLTDNVTAEFGYEGTFADDYQDHIGKAKLKLRF